jgi:hypothetical protein
MAFEKFHRDVFTKDQPIISILDRGQFAIGRVCYEKFLKDYYKFIVLYYDKDRRVIGLKPTNTKAPECYEVLVDPSGRLARISGHKFLKFFKIEHEKSHKYKVRWNEKEKLIELDLNQIK